MYSPYYFFFFNDTATTEIYTLSLHDALPIWRAFCSTRSTVRPFWRRDVIVSNTNSLIFGASPSDGSSSRSRRGRDRSARRSEEHTSELQSRQYLVCRLLLEKKKKNQQEKPAK